ncbi:MAG TPA: QueT transporter family protein [Clostridiales bacterium]|nr:QueT transporter family protein [Clostridiales bacterium]
MNKKTLYVVQGGVIAALYVALTFVSSSFGLAYGSIQFRLSEILTVLPLFTPAGIWGLAIGCMIANITSTLGVIDIVVGTAATLIAGLITRYCRNIKIRKVPIVSLIAPVIINAIFVGFELMWVSDNYGLVPFLTLAAPVFLGELAVITVGGIPLTVLLYKNNILKGKT